jgi:DNA helicase-2/ATP-dependent DNA helicase PcrA
MNYFEFTESEISSVCEELGIPRDAFDCKESQRRVIIDCWDNANIIACPGSGKTTVLLAKLLLLSRRMPFADGSGICVLTHTNVAIDEIKSKLGTKADILFKHPNFFGTIQSFVNNFLASPALNLYPDIQQKRISKVDSDYAYNQKKNEYFKIEFGTKDVKTLRNYLYGQANIGQFKTTTAKEKTENTNNLLKSLKFDLTDNIVKREKGKMGKPSLKLKGMPIIRQ